MEPTNEIKNEISNESFQDQVIEHLERNEALLTNVQTTHSDLFTLLSITLPLLFGLIIGLVALKTFWEGASKW